MRLIRTTVFAAVVIAIIYFVWDRVMIAGEDVKFSSGEIELAGTIFRPRFQSNVPGVILIHGSGKTDRSHMASQAKWFAHSGFAALAYDKRGTGESGGDPEECSYFNFDDLASDAAAAFRSVGNHESVDASRCGIYAVSQGGWIAPLAALKSGDVAFLVVVSASVSTVAEDRLFERGARLTREGFSEQDRDEVRRMQLVDHEVTRSGRTWNEYARLWEENHQKGWFRRVYLGDEPTPQDDEYRLWYRTVLDYDPVALLERVDAPVYWIYGDAALDRYGPVELSLDRLRTLQAAGKPYEITSYEETDHNLEYVDGGLGGLFRNATQHSRGPMRTWLEARMQRP